MLRPKRGAPVSYDRKKHLKIILDAVPKVMSIGQVANLTGIPRPTLQYWLKKGQDDQEQGLSTEFTHLLAEFRKLQAIEVYQLISDIKALKKNWPAAAWLLEKCFREDFGVDVELIKRIDQLEQILSKLTGSNING